MMLGKQLQYLGTLKDRILTLVLSLLYLPRTATPRLQDMVTLVSMRKHLSTRKLDRRPPRNDILY